MIHKPPMRLYIFFCLLIVFINGVNSQNNLKLDRIFELRELSKNSDFTGVERLSYAEEALAESKRLNIDSTILNSGRNLVVIYFQLDKIDQWLSLSRRNLSLGEKLSDTSAIAAAHYNLGLNKQFFEIEFDSAYYHYSKALKLYNILGNNKDVASLYLYLTSMQDDVKDYSGAEESAIKALRLFNQLEKTESNLDNIWTLYNMLGNISWDLEEYNEALEYHEKAIEVAEEMKDGAYNRTISLHNQASAYREQLQYKRAIELYDKLIKMRNIYEPYDPSFYPLIIDNIAYTKVLSGNKNYQEIENQFYEAYKISDSLDDDDTKLAISIDLAKYYKSRGMKDSSLKYAENSNRIAKKIVDNDLLLESMLLLSELKEGEEGKQYLKNHIRLTDSMLKVERLTLNKYARIELETDQLEAENEEISKRNFYLLLLSAGLLFTAILIYIIITQRAKNKELKLVQEQQQANEEIYNLMLNQQDKVEEARSQEKIRVSKELHDGVLGRLFGTRLSLDSLNFTEGKEAIKSRAAYIGQLKTIEEDIRKISHELNADFVSGSGFMDIVSELIETQSSAYNLKYSFHYTDDINWDVISNKIKINLYRILQESMQNIYKHAEAKTIDISILLKNDVIWVNIIDDGKGFDVDRGRKGIGLKNMNSRIKEIEGSIEFLSESNKGTTVHVKLPYNSQE